MQGFETANSEEESTSDAEENEMSDMVLASIFLGGVTGAALGSFLTAGRAVLIFGEVASLYVSIYHQQTFFNLSLMDVYASLHWYVGACNAIDTSVSPGV